MIRYVDMAVDILNAIYIYVYIYMYIYIYICIYIYMIIHVYDTCHDQKFDYCIYHSGAWPSIHS